MMRLAKFIEGQTRQASDHPAGFAVPTVTFGIMAGMQLSTLVAGEATHLYTWIFTLLLSMLSVWYAFVLTRAIRLLRQRPASPTSTAPQEIPR